jgi:hypothetical protein
VRTGKRLGRVRAKRQKLSALDFDKSLAWREPSAVRPGKRPGHREAKVSQLSAPPVNWLATNLPVSLGLAVCRLASNRTPATNVSRHRYGRYRNEMEPLSSSNSGGSISWDRSKGLPRCWVPSWRTCHPAEPARVDPCHLLAPPRSWRDCSRPDGRRRGGSNHQRPQNRRHMNPSVGSYCK